MDEMDKNFLPGEHVWIVERDCDGYARTVIGYMFLSQVEGYALVVPFCDGWGETVKTVMEGLCEESCRDFGTDVNVFPLCDCYRDKEKAKEAFYREKQNEID